MNVELAAVDSVGRGWVLLLAFTLAVFVVAALRRGCRRWFGTERAFQLWVLPPLAMLASQLPHTVVAPVVVVPSMAPSFAAVTMVLPAQVARHAAIDVPAAIAFFWIVGMVTSLCAAMAAQWRYRRSMRNAVKVTGLDLRWPVWRASATNVGPALVGAWRSRIVLPADFEQRYDTVEQALIIAHEATHAHRRDGWWCLLARLVAAMFWFHPLAWWALAALRHDQELACDAAVLRKHGSQRRSYANAMLKTQSAAFALPVGCPWSPRHPVTERIAMLKMKQPNSLRRRIGAFVLAGAGAGMAMATYAASPAPVATPSIMADRYTLDVDVAMGGQSQTTHLSYCVKPHAYIDANGTDADKRSWKGRFAVWPVAGGQIELRSQVDTRFDRGNGNVREESAKPVVRTLPGQRATIVFGQMVQGGHVEKTQDNTVKIGLTPTPGCKGDTSDSDVSASPSAAIIQEDMPADTVVAGKEYQLNTSIELTTNQGQSDDVKHATLALCSAPGKTATVKVHHWQIDMTPQADSDGGVRVDVTASDAQHRSLAQASMHGDLNGMLHAEGQSSDGKSRYTMVVTPLAGCPARTMAKGHEQA